MRVAVLGCGAIGGAVARAIHRGDVPGAQLTGVVHAGEHDPPDLPTATVEEVLAESDLVIECAGQRALSEIGPAVIAAGADLLAVSTGALADPVLLKTLRETGPGRLRLCTGAIGGLDLLSAAAGADGLDAVRIVTTKKASALLQPWMDQDLARRVCTTSEPLELARGPASEIVAAFPASANVAASVALAIGRWDFVTAAVVADPDAPRTSHVITAQGPAGEYRFEIGNHPSAENPATSGVVPHAVREAVARLASPTGAFA